MVPFFKMLLIRPRNISPGALPGDAHTKRHPLFYPTFLVFRLRICYSSRASSSRAGDPVIELSRYGFAELANLSSSVFFPVCRFFHLPLLFSSLPPSLCLGPMILRSRRAFLLSMAPTCLLHALPALDSFCLWLIPLFHALAGHNGERRFSARRCPRILERSTARCPC